MLLSASIAFAHGSKLGDELCLSRLRHCRKSGTVVQRTYSIRIIRAWVRTRLVHSNLRRLVDSEIEGQAPNCLRLPFFMN